MLNAVDGFEQTATLAITNPSMGNHHTWTAGVDMNLLENRLTLQANVINDIRHLLTLRRRAYVSVCVKICE
jgi:hypothetical protein